MNYNDAVEFVMKWEGNYANDPNDPGGETKYGISKRAYPDLDIANLTRDEAIAIYRRDYWDAIKADSLAVPLAFVGFNAAINCGVSRALKWLDACGGDYREFLRLQILHYLSLKSRLYLGGWMSRTMAAWDEAKKMEGV